MRLSDVTPTRTDTILDLSQKAEKGMRYLEREGVYVLLSMRELGNEYAIKAICLLILLCCACDL